MLRRLLPASAALFLLLLPCFGSAATFADVEGTRYRPAFTFLSQKGVVRGFADLTGRPLQHLTRAEALKVLLDLQPGYWARVAWFRTHMPKVPLFLDTEESAWYAPYIEVAFEEGIVTGYRGQAFRPGNAVTVEEAIVLLMRAYGQGSGEGAGPDGWFQVHVDAAVSRNLLAKEEWLSLGDRVTRGQFFDMLYRFDVVQMKKLPAFVDIDGSTTRPPLTRRPVPSVGAIANLRGNAAIFYLSIPQLGIESLRVTHPADSFTSKGLLTPLREGVGHLFGYPGGGTKIMIYGHSSGYAWDVSSYTKIFRRVNELRAGDKVHVSYGGRLHTYEVTHQEKIKPNDIRPFTGEGEELILYTCWPPDSTQERLIVHTKPVAVVALR